MVNDDFEDSLSGSPWRSHGAFGEVEVVGNWDMDDAYIDDDTDDDTDDNDDDTDHDNDSEAIWLWWWYWWW